MIVNRFIKTCAPVLFIAACVCSRELERPYCLLEKTRINGTAVLNDFEESDFVSITWDERISLVLEPLPRTTLRK
jgi:hypothetical protein